MGQAKSFDDAGYAIVTPSAGVPMLDWPRDLFSDDAGSADLEMEDFLLLSHSEELTVQLAA